VLLLQVLHLRHDQIRGVIRRLDDGRRVLVGLPKATSQLEGSPQAGARGRPDAEHALQLDGSGTEEPTQRPEPSNELVRDLELPLSANERCDQLDEVAPFDLIGNPVGGTLLEGERLHQRWLRLDTVGRLCGLHWTASRSSSPKAI
jgi:hypothetical protein